MTPPVEKQFSAGEGIPNRGCLEVNAHASAMVYNTQREVFPSSVIAGTFHFTAAELFVIDKPAQREAPKVSFS